MAWKSYEVDFNKMTEIHKVQCDKCGVKKNMKRAFANCYELPFRWVNIERNWLVDMDLCPNCKKLFNQHSEGFFE